MYRLTREEPWLAYLLERLENDDPEARAFATNALAGVADVSNTARIRAALIDALAKETSEIVRRNLKRDLCLLDAGEGMGA